MIWLDLPASGFIGQDSFTYEVTDGTNVTTATVRVNIANIHTVPDAHPGDPFVVNIGTDSVDAGETLTTRLVGLPDGAIVTDGTHTETVSSGDHLDISDWALQSITVTPPAGQTGNYLFHVETRSTDGADNSPWVSTPLRVQLDPLSTAFADATITGGLAQSTDEDSAVSGVLTVTDADAGEDHFVSQQNTDGSYGAFSIDASGHWTYTPDDRADALTDQVTAKETFVVQSADGSIEHVEITLAGTNDAPVVTATSATPVDLGAIAEDTGKTLTEADLLQMVGASDPEATDTLHITAATSPHGTFVKQPNGDWTFTPAADFKGDDVAVTVTVNDGHTDTEAQGTFDITPVTDTATPSLTVMAEQQVMEFAHGSASGIVNSDTISAGGDMHAFTIDMTILGGQQVASTAGHGATLLSYASPSDSNAMYIWNDAPGKDLTFRVGGQEYATGVAMMTDGSDHRYTFSWDGQQGTLDVLIDGQVVKHMDNVGQGATIPDGGKFALGNDQDSFGGGFSANDAFSGQIFNAAMAKAAVDPAQLEQAPLASLLDGDADLISNLQVENGQFVDTTGHHNFVTSGSVSIETVEVDTRIASPNYGATLLFAAQWQTPADTDDQATHAWLTGLPAGTVVEDGHGHSATITPGAPEVDLVGWQLDSVTGRMPSSFHGNLNIQLQVVTEGPDGPEARAEAGAEVVFDHTLPVPDVVAPTSDSLSGAVESVDIVLGDESSQADGASDYLAIFADAEVPTYAPENIHSDTAEVPDALQGFISTTAGNDQPYTVDTGMDPATLADRLDEHDKSQHPDSADSPEIAPDIPDSADDPGSTTVLDDPSQWQNNEP